MPERETEVWIASDTNKATNIFSQEPKFDSVWGHWFAHDGECDGALVRKEDDAYVLRPPTGYKQKFCLVPVGEPVKGE